MRNIAKLYWGVRSGSLLSEIACFWITIFMLGYFLSWKDTDVFYTTSEWLKQSVGYINRDDH